MNRVLHKTCIVTGGAVGIGRACVEKLAHAGARVAIVDLQEEAGHALASDLDGRGMAVRYWHVDVGDEAQVARAIEDSRRLIRRHRRAGQQRRHRRRQQAHARDHRSRVGPRAGGSTSRACSSAPSTRIPHLRRAGGGSIINLSSIYGLVGAPDVPPYHASKGAVRLMSKTDALLYAADGIRVNSIHPGYIWTPMVEQHLRDSGAAEWNAAAADVGQLHPLGHIGEPDDIAWGVVYLASDEVEVRHRRRTGDRRRLHGALTARPTPTGEPRHERCQGHRSQQ